MANNVKLLDQFFAAENKRDWTAYRGYLHPEVMWFIHTEDAHMPVAGREEYMDRVMSGYKDSDATFVCEGVEVSTSGKRIVAYLRNSSGSRSVNIFDFEDSLIRWEHEFVLD